MTDTETVSIPVSEINEIVTELSKVAKKLERLSK